MPSRKGSASYNRHSGVRHVPRRDERDLWVVNADMVDTADPGAINDVRRTVQTLEDVLHRRAEVLATKSPADERYGRLIVELEELHGTYVAFHRTLRGLKRIEKIARDTEAAKQWSAESEAAAWARRENSLAEARRRSARR